MSCTINQILNEARKHIGVKEGTSGHRAIIDDYNAHKPLARGYKVKYSDNWCATFISFLAIKCGATYIIPTECSCGQMIELMKKKGIWIENDNITPKVGDIIMYDWDKKDGWPEHVGIVEKVSGSTITVIEGNKNNAVARRSITVGNTSIRGYGRPKYKAESKPTKTLEQIAKEVIDGKWGDGAERKKALEKAGYNYDSVQEKVNELLKKPSKPKHTTGRYKVTASDLIVREGPGTNYKMKGHNKLTTDGKKHDKDCDGDLDKGTVVDIIEVKGNWGRCPSGWLCMDYLKKK